MDMTKTNKMKATELRIGNWVDADIVKKQMQVTSILDKGVNCKELGLLYDMIEPIPLTEEWLERFGFEIECLAANDCRAVKGDFYITLDHDGSTVIGYPTSIGMRNKWMFVQDIEHVHQLQNLYFALTGEELNSAE